MKLKIIIIILACIVLAAGAFYWVTKDAAVRESGVDVFLSAKQQNTEFVAALASAKRGDYTEATDLFQKALASAKTQDERILISFYLADATKNAGDYLGAATVYKQIAAEAANPSYLRALAVESIGQLYVRYPDGLRSLFVESPYQELFVATSTNQTKRNIFNYAAAIYPLPISEYYIADSYARAIISRDLSTTSPETKIIWSKAREAIAAGDAAAADVGFFTKPDYLPEAQTVKAIALRTLQKSGDAGVEVEAEFRTALDMYATRNVAYADAFARLQYASFLLESEGDVRAADMHAILAPLYDGSSNGRIAVRQSLTEKSDAPLEARERLIQLANMDADFKTYLVSLGWAESDFN